MVELRARDTYIQKLFLTQMFKANQCWINLGTSLTRGDDVLDVDQKKSQRWFHQWEHIASPISDIDS